MSGPGLGRQTASRHIIAGDGRVTSATMFPGLPQKPEAMGYGVVVVGWGLGGWVGGWAGRAAEVPMGSELPPRYLYIPASVLGTFWERFRGNVLGPLPNVSNVSDASNVQNAPNVSNVSNAARLGTKRVKRTKRFKRY